MAEYFLDMPPKRQDIERLNAGDIVWLSGDVVTTGGAPSHKRLINCLDTVTPPPLSMNGTLLQLPHMLERNEDTGDYHIHYVNPTTSMRFDAYMPRLIEGYSLKIVGGKGGLSATTAKAMKNYGCVYLSIVGGASPVLTEAIAEVIQSEYRDLPAHFWLSKLRVKNFGPLTVGIDSKGQSIYEIERQAATDKLPQILQQLQARREKAD